MKYIISGTNRPQSRTRQVAEFVQKLYAEHGEQTEIIDLTDVGLEQLAAAAPYGDVVPEKMRAAIEKINSAEGIVVVCPEYNGSMPGALKYFIDHWSYPTSFEFRPIALVGLGGRFGALRPVEHLQGVFGYRNAFIYPERVFISNVNKAFDDEGRLVDENIKTLLKNQTKGFLAFIKALSAAGLDANSRIGANK